MLENVLQRTILHTFFSQLSIQQQFQNDHEKKMRVPIRAAARLPTIWIARGVPYLRPIAAAAVAKTTNGKCSYEFVCLFCRFEVFFISHCCCYLHRVDDNETPAKQTQAIAPLFLVIVRDGIHEIQFDKSTLMTSSGHKSVRPLFHGICGKIVKTFLLEGNIRVPVCLSSTSSQLEVEPLPLTTPIVYIRYKDTNFSEIEKIGMGMAMKNRYPQEVLERCYVLCNTTWAYHQDGDVRKLLEEFLIAIDNSSQVPDALKDIFKLYKRGGNKLGMEHNLYMQMLEISCQLYFGQVVPVEAFTCDEKKLLKRRQKVAAVVNYLLPNLFDLLKANGEMVF